MPTYFYTARDSVGGLVKGSLSAESKEELSEKLTSMGYLLTHASFEEGRQRVSRGSASSISSSNLITFTIHLNTLLEAGVPLLEGLKGLSQQTEKKRLSQVIEGIYHHLESGESFSQALKGYPKIFSNLYIGIVKAGESSGKLDMVLSWLANFLEWQRDLKSQFRDAFIYPAILITLMVGLVILLLTFAFPKFVDLFSTMNLTLPLITRVLLSLSQFSHTYWLYFLLGFFGLLVGGFFWTRTKRGRLKFDYLKLRIPIIGNLIHKVALSRFAHTLSILLNSGVNILTSLSITEGVVNNVHLSKAIGEIKQKIKTGETISQALKEDRNFPSLVVTMVAVGESSGFLERSLERICQFYDHEVPRGIKRLFAFIEPLLILFMGVVVGLIALSIFLPLFQLMTMI